LDVTIDQRSLLIRASSKEYRVKNGANLDFLDGILHFFRRKMTMTMIFPVVILFLHTIVGALLLPPADAWVVVVSRPLRVQQRKGGSSTTTAIFNLLDDFLGYNDPTKMPRVASLPYGDPILPDARRAIQERGISFTGEDFDVCELPGQKPVCRVRGALLHLPGKDQMRLTSAADGQVHAKLDRKLMAIKSLMHHPKPAKI
jgi:hypothetical protein